MKPFLAKVDLFHVTTTLFDYTLNIVEFHQNIKVKVDFFELLIKPLMVERND
jgi:hypothetical protein